LSRKNPEEGRQGSFRTERLHLYSERLAELDLPTLEERRREADMAQVYKIPVLSDDNSE
jgi:hypothetical protein